AGPVEGEDGEELPEARLAREEERCDRRLRRRPERVGCNHHLLPRQPVRDEPAEEEEDAARDEADREDETERRRRAGQVEHRERERDRHERAAELRGGAAEPEEAEVPRSG